MDLNSLPDEMLTRILTYTNFVEARQLRKMNQIIDRIARRANIGTKIPVTHFDSFDDDYSPGFTLSGSVAELLGETVCVFVDESRMNTKQFYEKWFSRVEIIDRLTIESIDFTEDLVPVFRKNIRKATGLRFVNVNFSISSRSAQKLIEAMRSNIFDFSFKNCTGKMENIIRKEVFQNRKFKSFVMINRKNTLEAAYLNDDFLLSIGTKSKRIFISVKNTSFTVTGILNTIKKCYQQNGSYTANIYLREAKIGNLDRFGIVSLFKQIAPGIKGPCEYTWGYRMEFDDSFDPPVVEFHPYEIFPLD